MVIQPGMRHAFLRPAANQSTPSLVDSVRALTTEEVKLPEKPRLPSELKKALAVAAAGGLLKAAFVGAVGCYAGAHTGFFPVVAGIYLGVQAAYPAALAGALTAVLTLRPVFGNRDWVETACVAAGLLGMGAGVAAGIYLGATPDHATMGAVLGGVAGLLTGAGNTCTRYCKHNPVDPAMQDYETAMSRYRARLAEVEASRQRAATRTDQQTRADASSGAVQESHDSVVIGAIRLAKRVRRLDPLHGHAPSSQEG